MKNKLLKLILLSFMVVPIWGHETYANEFSVYKYEETDIPFSKENIDKNMISSHFCEMEKIKDYEDKLSWFKAYKAINERYKDWVDVPETLYDYFSKKELNKLFKTVEAECTGGDFDSKCNVASVIFNRLEHEDFGNTLDKVIIKSQFSPLKDGRYYKVDVTEETMLACEYAFEIEDTTGGALYFDCAKDSWASRNKKKIFTDEIGHTFYK